MLIDLGGLRIYSYGFLYMCGAIAAGLYGARQGRAQVGLRASEAMDLLLCLLVAAMVGGKLFSFLEDPLGYAAHPARLLRNYGFVFYGSFLLCVPTLLWFARRRNIDGQQLLDVVAVSAGLMHIFGRLGCLMAGCCYGVPTDMPWGVSYVDHNSIAIPRCVPLHPVQVYEALYMAAVTIGLVLFRERARFAGQLFLLYVISYAVGRVTLERLRGDAGRGFLFAGAVSHSQLIALIVVAAALAVWYRWAVVDASDRQGNCKAQDRMQQ